MTESFHVRVEFESPLGPQVLVHRPFLDLDLFLSEYKEEDGTPVQYVCTTSHEKYPYVRDIFYRESPHPEFGNRYFGLGRQDPGTWMISSADHVEDLEFACIRTEEGLHYSQSLHDFNEVHGGFIDGGRAYARCSTPGIVWVVFRDGKPQFRD